MNSVSFTFKAKPISWKRAMYYKNRYIDLQKREKRLVKAEAIKQYSSKLLLFPAKTPIAMSMHFWFEYPMYLSGFKGDRQFHRGVPDLSNLIKFYEDALKGIVYDDDRQISNISAFKGYDEEYRVDISFCSLDGEIQEDLDLSV